MAATPAMLVSFDDYLEMPDQERFEWVDGRLLERSMSWYTSWVAGNLLGPLSDYVRKHGLGYVSGADNGLILTAGDRRAFRFADVSFTRADRVPDGIPDHGHQEITPDLAVEVVSPGDDAYEVDLKIQDYLDAGVRLIWVIYPRTRSVTAIRRDGSTSRVSAPGELNGEDVLPGFTLPIAAIFETPTTP